MKFKYNNRVVIVFNKDINPLSVFADYVSFYQGAIGVVETLVDRHCLLYTIRFPDGSSFNFPEEALEHSILQSAPMQSWFIPTSSTVIVSGSTGPDTLKYIVT